MLFERVLVHRGGRPRRIPDERGTAEGVQGKEAGRYETPLAAWQNGGYSLTDGQNTPTNGMGALSGVSRRNG
jgi:hypothetical protein